MQNGFLPISRKDMEEAGIKQLDFVYVCGDAYVDHPSFGHAIISRILQAHGYTVGIIAQPDYRDKESVTILGEPRLGFLVSGGNMDSMVNHYSVSKKRRAHDAFTPGGVMGKRPDYAVVSYCNLLRQTYKHNPIIIGGIEASLRRLGHYDYWSNKVKRSIKKIFMMPWNCRLLIKSKKTRQRMPRAFTCSIRIQTLLRQEEFMKPMMRKCLSYRTLRQSH